MENEKKPLAKVNVRRDAKGGYWFELTWRGVTRPATGPFRSQLEAAAAAQSAVKLLEAARK
jgi:hypothetical protein